MKLVQALVEQHTTSLVEVQGPFVWRERLDIIFFEVLGPSCLSRNVELRWSFLIQNHC